MNKIIATYSKKAEDILRAGRAQEQATAERLEAAEAKETALKAEVSVALVASDQEAYRAAKLAHADALADVELLSDRLERLKTAPFVTEIEYGEAIAEIMAALADEDNKARVKISALADEMRQINSQLADTLDEGNKLLHTWQHEIYKDDACKVNNAGKRVYILDLEKQYVDVSVAYCCDKALTALGAVLQNNQPG